MAKGPQGQVKKVAQVAGALPAPIKALTDFMFPQDDPMGGLSPAKLGPAVAGTVRIPFDKLQEALEGGLGWDLLKKGQSRLLKSAYDPRGVGSSEAARIASGMRPSHSSAMGGNIPRDYQVGGLDALPYGRMPDPVSRADARLAQRELYKVSQRALDELGVPADETVELFRTGPVPKTPYALTPTHVSDEEIRYWGKYPVSVPYQVPRKDIRALVGLLHRGDDLTAGEILVPSHSLLPIAKNKGVPRIDPDMFQHAQSRIPSWAKKPIR